MKCLRACACVVALSSALGAQETPPRFRSRAELVTVDVLVTDRRRPVTGLVAADFELRDNGVPQTIQQLQLEQLPLDILMVLDASSSMEGERLAALKQAALAMVDRLRRQDRAALLAFSHRIELRSPLTADRGRLREAIQTLVASGSTSLRDAAYAGFALRGTESGRALMLLFSDGVDTASFLDERRLMDVARRSDVTVYPIGIREPRVRGRMAMMPADDAFLEALAKETGGRMVHAEGNRDLGPVFTRVLDEFNKRYVLGYSPAGVSTTGWHRIEVKLKNRRGTVTARRGYFAR